MIMAVAVALSARVRNFMMRNIQVRIRRISRIRV
jgi:HAMP domain-containing protein